MDGDAFGFFWDRDGKQSSRGGPGFDAGSIKFQTYIDGTNATNLTNGRLLGKTTHGDRSCFFRVGSNGDPWRDHHMEAGEFRGGGKRNDKRKGVISRELLRHGTGEPGDARRRPSSLDRCHTRPGSRCPEVWQQADDVHAAVG